MSKTCPKYIAEALMKRAKAAATCMNMDSIVVDYLEANDMLDCVEDYDILGGCESYVNPYASSQRVIRVINSELAKRANDKNKEK